MGKVTNIEYGNIDYEKVIIESGNIEFNFENGNIDSKTGSNGGSNRVVRGWGGGGPPADDDRGCYDPVLTPFDPVLLSMLSFSKLNSVLPSLWFRFNQPPHFSMLPYSMLVTFPDLICALFAFSF